ASLSPKELDGEGGEFGLLKEFKSRGSLLSDEGGETLVSARRKFELGFFTLEESSVDRSYVGIWYYRSNPRIVVWIANRNRPLFDSGAVFAVTGDGNLGILDRNGNNYWSTELKSTSKPAYREAKLLDSGNLVLGDKLLANSLWQSFEHPTDTFLPGMKMNENLKLISWKSQVDPAEGNFTFQQEEETKQFVIWNGYTKHWTSGESGNVFSSETMPDGIAYFLSNFTRSNRTEGIENFPSNLTRVNRTGGIDYTRLNRTLSDYTNTRIRLDMEGKLQYWTFDTNWSLLWWEPRDKCSVLNACGNFGSCNPYNKLACKCLPGFEPKSPENWKNGDFSGGCIRSSAVCGKNDTFLSLKMMRVGRSETRPVVEDENKCREECLNNCRCQAYSYIEGEPNRRRDRQPSNNVCWIWIDDLKDLQEEYSYGGLDLFVRVTLSDIESKAKSCEPCGTNVIPYPLSTGSDCGDPMYFNFYCDNSTGEISFKTHNDTYSVTTINPDTRTFFIQVTDVGNCNSSTRGEIQKFNLSFPFKVNTVNPWCDAPAGNTSSDVPSQGIFEIDIGWEPPPEPICTSSADCEDWPNSTCNVTGDTARCLCDSNFRWDGIALNCAR
ncbi:unnamed protein product, partial [Dovyalis caffra]